jgi:NAD(P) transhydrogenase subunit alpha
MSKEFLDAEYALFREQARDVDIVITTALIPGRAAPKLWFKDMVEAMKPGSVIVDLAAEKGGNCELTVPGEVIEHQGVTIIGYTDLASRMARVASDLYGTNLWHFLEEMGGAKGHRVDHDNDAVRPALVLEGGEKRWPAPPMKKADAPAAPPKPAPELAPAKPAEAAAHGPAVPPPKRSHGPAPRAPSRTTGLVMSAIGLVAAIAFLAIRYGKSDSGASFETYQLLQHLTVFVMAIFVGFQVIWNVTPALHTPLMSVTNAISGIIVVGGLLQAAGRYGIDWNASIAVAVVATLFATINIAGGFLVTRRMLAMFRK